MNEQNLPPNAENVQENAPQADTLSDILGKILSSFPTESQQAPQAATDRPNTAQASAQSKATPDIFSSLLSNPELLSKLPSIISAVKPILDMLGRSQDSGTTQTAGSMQTSVNTPKSDQAIPAIAPMNQSKKEPDHRADLLCAMKPYLNKDRQDAIDYIIKLSRLSDILKTL